MPPPKAGFTALELCERAARFLAERGTASEAEVLRHVYGGLASVALWPKLAAPLLVDPRLERLADGSWTLRRREAQSHAAEFTALALAATGPSPIRARLVRICALHVRSGEVLDHFDAIVKPERHIPRYVAERTGVDPALLDEHPAFGNILDDLVGFLADRPVLAQDARLTWEFVEAEARRSERIVVTPPLIDLNELANRSLALKGKPSLGLVAAQCGVSTLAMARVDEEARVLALVGARLFEMTDPVAATSDSTASGTLLRRAATARSLANAPGVYVLRDREQAPLYVGKARRLNSRVAAYVHRPLGPTRRLEGLIGAVDALDSTQCDTDLEALILEDREIRRLRPRFNTVRRLHPPRYWIRMSQPPRGAPRLELSGGPARADGQFVGPFRNEMLARRARSLAREVFELDTLRHADAARYAERLNGAWAFLEGDSDEAEGLARARTLSLLRKVLDADVGAWRLPADPRQARYAVLRPDASGIEGFVIQLALFITWARLDDNEAASDFARRLLGPSEPRTTAEERDVVLRWFGAQRPPARLVLLPDDDELAAVDVIQDALLDLGAPEA